MKYEITQETLQKLAAYLALKPWQEANPLIQELAQLKPIEQETEKEESK